MNTKKSRTFQCTDKEWAIITEAVAGMGFSATKGRGNGIVELARLQIRKKRLKDAKDAK